MLNGIEEIDGLTPEQIEAINKKAEGVLNKNQELLDKLNKTKQTVDSSTSEVESLRQFKENAEIQMAHDSKNWEEKNRLLEEKYQRELQQTKEENEKNSSLVKKLVVDNALQSELVTMGVNPNLLDLVTSNMSSQAQVVDGKAMINEKSLSDYLTEWAETPVGKASILAPNNSGTGSGGGSNNGAGQKTMTRSDFEQKPQAERQAFFQSGGKLTD